MSKDAYFKNVLYELDPELTFDKAGETIRFVRSRVYTKEHEFKDPFSNKELQSLDVNMDSIQGDFEFTVRYKASHSPYFLDWQTFTHTAPWRLQGMPCSEQFYGFDGHTIRDFTMGAPLSEACSPVTNDWYKVFRRMQLCLDFVGKYWELKEYRLRAVQCGEVQNESICEDYTSVLIPSKLDNDWETEDFETCRTLQT